MSNVRFFGLDVHADTIAVAVAEPDGEVRPLGVIPNRLESIRKLVAKLGPAKQVKACYAAGPTGYVVYLATDGPRGCLPGLRFTLRGVDRTHPYLTARGIERGTAEEFGVGLFRGPGILSGRVVHDQHGILVAYCGRAVAHSQPRYLFPPGFAKSEILFDFHRAAATEKPAVVVVEGFFDCLKLHQAGVRSVVALMGSALYESQERLLLERFQRVVLMLDGDAAGRRATAEMTARLRPHCSVQVVSLPLATQPDQITSAEVWHVLRRPTGPSSRVQ
jgi:5S rRNA maturation endonuclease (ribonuclease M5)